MSLKARRLSKSEDDKQLLESPKVRDKSRRPLVMCRVSGPGRGVVMRQPVVGEIMYGLVEKYTFDKNPLLFMGPAWESLPCTVLSILEHDIVVMTTVPDDFETKDGHGWPPGPMKLKVPRIDEINGERPKDDDDKYKSAQWYRRT